MPEPTCARPRAQTSSAQTRARRVESDIQRELVELLERVKPKLEAIAYRLGVRSEDTEDLVQQVLLAFVQKRDRIECAEAWLVGSFRRECLQHLRSRQRRLYDAIDSTLLESVCSPTPPAQERDQLIRDLDSAISRTSPKCRQLLRLRYRLGFETEEIAGRLGYQGTSVRKIASRCLAALSRQVVVGG